MQIHVSRQLLCFCYLQEYSNRTDWLSMDDFVLPWSCQTDPSLCWCIPSHHKKKQFRRRKRSDHFLSPVFHILNPLREWSSLQHFGYTDKSDTLNNYQLLNMRCRPIWILAIDRLDCQEIVKGSISNEVNATWIWIYEILEKSEYLHGPTLNCEPTNVKDSKVLQKSIQEDVKQIPSRAKL